MAALDAVQLYRAAEAFASRALLAAYQVESDDDAIERFNVEIFKRTLDLDGPPSQRERGCRHVLIARSLERIGDNAVGIAEQAAFLETKQLRRFTDASTPHRRLGGP